MTIHNSLIQKRSGVDWKMGARDPSFYFGWSSRYLYQKFIWHWNSELCYCHRKNGHLRGTSVQNIPDCEHALITPWPHNLNLALTCPPPHPSTLSKIPESAPENYNSNSATFKSQLLKAITILYYYVDGKFWTIITTGLSITETDGGRLFVTGIHQAIN